MDAWRVKRVPFLNVGIRRRERPEAVLRCERNDGREDDDDGDTRGGVSYRLSGLPAGGGLRGERRLGALAGLAGVAPARPST